MKRVGFMEGIGAVQTIRTKRIASRDRIDPGRRIGHQAQTVGAPPGKLLSPDGEAASTKKQCKYKQPSDQQPGFSLECLKYVFIVYNRTKPAPYATLLFIRLSM